MTTSKQTGAVSLFVVIFTSLLVTIATVSFIRIMMQDQQQASRVDLSQSAYDSALAGVEDGKRAILKYQGECANIASSECSLLKTQLESSICNASIQTLLSDDVVIANGEVKVQQPGLPNQMDQAYTCVKVNLDTFDYIGSSAANQSNVIPLKTISGFNRVTLEWFNSYDLVASGAGGYAVNSESVTDGLILHAQNNWPLNRPPIMRVQLIQVAESGFTLSDFDTSNHSSSQSNTNTVFLYPTRGGNTSINIIDRDIRRSSATQPIPVHCEADLSQGGYACKVTIAIPVPIGGGARGDTYLHIEPLYNRAQYRVTTANGATPVRFNAVQPEIDSNGRASDLFRRVQARVELFGGSNYPEAAVSITGNFCKTFFITDQIDGYAPGNCTP